MDKNFTLWNDLAAKVALSENNDLVKDMINGALEAEGIKVEIDKVETQKVFNSLKAKGIIADGVATDTNGNVYQIEIQNDYHEGFEERLAYGDSYMIQLSLLHGQPYDTMRKHTVIAYCRFQPSVSKVLPIYHVRRRYDETGEIYPDRGKIIIINGAYKHDLNTLLGKVIHDLDEPEAQKMLLKSFRNAMEYLKDTKEGEEKMGTYEREAHLSGVVSMVRMFLEDGESIERIQKLLKNQYTEKDVQEIIAKSLQSN